MVEVSLLVCSNHLCASDPATDLADCLGALFLNEPSQQICEPGVLIFKELNEGFFPDVVLRRFGDEIEAAVRSGE